MAFRTTGILTFVKTSILNQKRFLVVRWNVEWNMQHLSKVKLDLGRTWQVFRDSFECPHIHLFATIHVQH